MGRRPKYKASDDALAQRDGLLAIAGAIEHLASEIGRATGASAIPPAAPEEGTTPPPVAPSPEFTIQPAETSESS